MVVADHEDGNDVVDLQDHGGELERNVLFKYLNPLNNTYTDCCVVKTSYVLASEPCRFHEGTPCPHKVSDRNPVALDPHRKQSE